MNVEELMKRKGEYPVDEIIGRIVSVDRIKRLPSRFGDDQDTQAIVVEDAERRRFAVEVYDLNLRCFSGQCGPGGREVNFDGSHIGEWLRLRNTSAKGKTANLRRLRDSSDAAKHHAKMGVKVTLKATGASSMFWLLDEHSQPPLMRKSSDYKANKKLRVPGQPADRQIRNAAQVNREAPRDMKRDPEDLSRHMAWLTIACMKYIRAAYDKQGLALPSEEQVISISQTIMISLMKKISILSESVDHIKRCCWALASFYAIQHKAIIKATKDEDIPETKMIPLTTTCFIWASGALPLPKKASRDDGERSRQ